MNEPLVGLIGMLVMVVLFMLRMPIGLSMFLVGFGGIVYLLSFTAAYSVIAKDVYSTFASYDLTVIPLFMWMGYIAFRSGISGRLFNAAYKLIGHIRGGVAMAVEIASAAFGAICGSTAATCATMGAVALPELKKYNYSPSLATASVAAGGILGIMIPPSTVFMVYGIMTEQSISKLFIAGILPGILLMLLYMGAIAWVTWRDPDAGPAGPKSTLVEKLTAMLGGVGETLIIFLLVIGGMFAGWFTPTEGAGVGAFGILMVSLIRRQLKWKGFVDSLTDSTMTSAMVFLIIAGAIVFGRFMALSQIPDWLIATINSLQVSRVVVFAIVLLIYLVLGAFIDSLAMMVITLPIFYPLVVTSLGFDSMWFAVQMVLICGMGLLTPPVGMNVYVVSGIAKDVPLTTIFSGIWPFLGAVIICEIILIAFPEIATWLPSLISY